MKKIYTQDWFSPNIERFEKYLSIFKKKDGLKFLEIGSFEGRSTNWLLDNILTGKDSEIYCVDTFEGSYEHKILNLDLNNLYDIFCNNIQDKKDKVNIFKGTSKNMLLSDSIRKNKFDFIYIDGCHESKEVLEDAVLSFELLKKDGIMIFDDYLWGDYNNHQNMTPKIAIETFIKTYSKYIKVLCVEYQVVIQKIGE